MNELPLIGSLLYTQIDLFTDTAAILISIVSNSYYGMPRGQIHINLPPGHPIIAIRNNRNQNGRRIGKKVYCSGIARGQTLQVAVRKYMAETYSTSKKRFWREFNAFFDTVFGLGNVDTWQV